MTEKNKRVDKSISNKNFPKTGEIWLVKFKPTKEARKPYRPCLVISSDLQNEFDERIIIAPFTTDKLENIKLVEVYVKNTPETGLDEPSKVQMNYPFNVDKELRLVERLGKVNQEIMNKVKKARELTFDWD